MDNIIRIVVHKSKGALEIWAGEECRHRLPAGIGRGGSGPKRREGDLKTPEGEYRVCVKNPKSQFYLSIGLSYPNPEDARAGLERRLIDESQYRAICEAHASGNIPPWKTPLGGEIYIHGNREKSGSTRGCVCLNDSDMALVFDLVSVGTPVTIFS